MSEGGVDITHQHSTHNQHIAHISRTVLSTSVVVSVLIVSQRSCSSSGRTVLHGLHAYLWLKKKEHFHMDESGPQGHVFIEVDAFESDWLQS